MDYGGRTVQNSRNYVIKTGPEKFGKTKGMAVKMLLWLTRKGAMRGLTSRHQEKIT